MGVACATRSATWTTVEGSSTSAAAAVPSLADRGAAQVAADRIREVMWVGAGIARTAKGLRHCLAELDSIVQMLERGDVALEQSAGVRVGDHNRRDIVAQLRRQRRHRGSPDACPRDAVRQADERNANRQRGDQRESGLLAPHADRDQGRGEHAAPHERACVRQHEQTDPCHTRSHGQTVVGHASHVLEEQGVDAHEGQCHDAGRERGHESLQGDREHHQRDDTEGDARAPRERHRFSSAPDRRTAAR
mgnify:CR=1 FL=1